MLIDDLSFTLPRNGIVGVIGPNGVGKTTLFKTIVGLEPLTSGNLEIGETVKISYVDQMRGGIDPDKTLWEVVSDGLDIMQVAENEVPSRAYVASFGFKGQDQQKRAGVLSGGERNRLNLALTLKQGGNLLLLDEPTTTSMSRRSPRLSPRCWSSRAAPWSSATTACSSTAWPPTSSRGRAPTRTPATGIGSRATSSSIRRTASPAWVRTPPSRTASTASSRATKLTCIAACQKGAYPFWRTLWHAAIF